MSEAQLDVVARYFKALSSRFRHEWRTPFSQCYGFLTDELHKYGSPGLQFTRGCLEELVADGLRLHLPDAEPRFVALDDQYRLKEEP